MCAANSRKITHVARAEGEQYGCLNWYCTNGRCLSLALAGARREAGHGTDAKRHAGKVVLNTLAGWAASG